LIFSVALSVTLIAQDSARVKIRKDTQDTLKSVPSDAGKMNLQNRHSRRFVDKNGDGYNDNAPDHDGDGIPNGLDPDYKGSKNRWRNRGFNDADVDGANAKNSGQGKRGRRFRHGRTAKNSGQAEDSTGVKGSAD
jgi:hypothetical protein